MSMNHPLKRLASQVKTFFIEACWAICCTVVCYFAIAFLLHKISEKTGQELTEHQKTVIYPADQLIIDLKEKSHDLPR